MSKLSVLIYSFACEPTKCAFRSEGDEKRTGYRNRGLGFGGQQAQGRIGILVVSLRFYLYMSDEIAENIGHIGQMEEIYGEYRASSEI